MIHGHEYILLRKALGSVAYADQQKDLMDVTKVCHIYVKHKVRIRTIRGFCCANLGSKDLLRKPRIRTQSSRIAQPNLGHPRQQTHDQSRKQSSSAIGGNEAKIDRASKAARPSAAKKPRSIAHAKQLGHPRKRTHDRSLTHFGSVGNDPTIAYVYMRKPSRSGAWFLYANNAYLITNHGKSKRNTAFMHKYFTLELPSNRQTINFIASLYYNIITTHCIRMGL